MSISIAAVNADRLLADAARPLVVGIGGGGDVVGALAIAESARLAHASAPVVGGITWERRPIDPVPGPRTVEEIEGAEPVGDGVLLAGPGTAVVNGGPRFAEARMAEFLGRPTVLVDPNGGPRAVARGVAQAAARLEADLLVFLDVGGDVLAEGHEPGLVSPLCDAVMLAAAAALGGREGAPPVMAGLFGAGCDGELTVAEVTARLAVLGRQGALAGARGITPEVARLLEGAVGMVPTEASAHALSCFHGAIGNAPIRGGERSVELGPLGALTFFFDVSGDLAAIAPLAAAVAGAESLEEANQILNARSVYTELDREREHGASRN